MSGADIDWHCVLKTSVFDLMSVSKVQTYRGSEDDWLVLKSFSSYCFFIVVGCYLL